MWSTVEEDPYPSVPLIFQIDSKTKHGCETNDNKVDGELTVIECLLQTAARKLNYGTESQVRMRPKVVEVKVRQQRDSFSCGERVLLFAEKFMLNPEAYFDKEEVSP